MSAFQQNTGKHRAQIAAAAGNQDLHNVRSTKIVFILQVHAPQQEEIIIPIMNHEPHEKHEPWADRGGTPGIDQLILYKLVSGIGVPRRHPGPGIFILTTRLNL